MTNNISTDEKVGCRICGKQFNCITNTHLKSHDISIAEYLTQNPDSALVTIQHRKKMSSITKGKIFGPMSDERKAKLRAAKLGKKLSEEHREHISAALMGRPGWSKGIPSWNKGLKGVMGPNVKGTYRKGHIPWMTGRKNPHSEEQRKKMSIALSGDKNPAWVHGQSRRKYPFQFSDELKELIRKRDEYKCQRCGKSQAESKRKLPVHHIDYNKDNLDPFNLITLCYPCHGRTMHKREYWTETLRLCVNE